MTDSELDQLYKEAALRCFYNYIPCDDSPNGPISRWVQRNIKFRESTLFYIVLGIAAELAKLERDENPTPPKYCSGQMRLFEVEEQYIWDGHTMVRNPRYGKFYD